MAFVIYLMNALFSWKFVRSYTSRDLTLLFWGPQEPCTYFRSVTLAVVLCLSVTAYFRFA